MLALGLIVGAVVGSLLGQASLGLLVGGGFGIAVALLLFVIDRRR